MAGQRFNRIDWFDFFPVKDRLLQGLDGANVLLVDVGGGRGHRLQRFRSRFPDDTRTTTLVLQDLPDVIDAADDLDEGIVKMAHDFFTLQPIKGEPSSLSSSIAHWHSASFSYRPSLPIRGVRAYYFRSIFHNWPDSKCREILAQIRPAMTRGHSRIFINDWILPDQGAALYPSLLDINMMTLFSSMERTETQWRTLIESVDGASRRRKGVLRLSWSGNIAKTSFV
ncbi:uncharacterized protein Z518_02490 [Rhinocladiella mackenziei CBS 650.93]|uniref:O-methyltransferase C-terminal domain-containing protein n=1 Tax=Rhinocladiella mackenziei CBS 650.93 TaxID=1442369 RepID=A0A0D2IWS2_9EURO|nr:uncharacterized protein Z518_02490 [Rhinocladiella mackenziei CBS 650.93]KIX07836.1 hypothetical protein Z518_02490 [Rhinocladiella mackenziei CBS 650.93]